MRNLAARNMLRSSHEEALALVEKAYANRLDVKRCRITPAEVSVARYALLRRYVEPKHAHNSKGARRLRRLMANDKRVVLISKRVNKALKDLQGLCYDNLPELDASVAVVLDNRLKEDKPCGGNSFHMCADAMAVLSWCMSRCPRSAQAAVYFFASQQAKSGWTPLAFKAEDDEDAWMTKLTEARKAGSKAASNAAGDPLKFAPDAGAPAPWHRTITYLFSDINFSFQCF